MPLDPRSTALQALIALGVLLSVIGCSSAPPTSTASVTEFQDFEQTVRKKTQGHSLPHPSTSNPTKLSPRELLKEPALRLKSHADKKKIAPPSPLTQPTTETLVLDMRFSGTRAGELFLETQTREEAPHQTLKRLAVHLKTNSFFSIFFRMNDTLTLDYDAERLLPIATEQHIEESRKRQEVRTYYDWNVMKAQEWENTIEHDEPLKHRYKAWQTKPGAQSLLSSLIYLRAQPLVLGRSIEFPITHDEKNFLFHADVLRREAVQTALGSISCVVLRASQAFTELLNKTRGESLLWLSDDERKLLVQIETPLKLGKLSGKLKSVRVTP